MATMLGTDFRMTRMELGKGEGQLRKRLPSSRRESTALWTSGWQ